MPSTRPTSWGSATAFGRSAARMRLWLPWIKPGDRLPARGRGEAASRGAQGQAGAVRPVAPRGQDPADRVRTVRHRATSSCRAATPGDLRLPGLHALLRKDQERQVRGQTEDASHAQGEKVEGRPAGPAASDARSCTGAASLAWPGPAGSLPVLRRDLQLSSLARVQGLRRQAMAEGARQAKPERPRELGVLQVDPDRLPTARPGPPSGVARMIHPPQVGLEEPIAVTPHDGICGGESQQWLSYPTNPHVRFDERGRETERCHTRPKLPRPSSTLRWPSLALTINVSSTKIVSTLRSTLGASNGSCGG